MTLAPATLAASAVELRDDDGQPVATIYARESGVEIVCQAGYSAMFAYDAPDVLIAHLGVTFTRETEARRR
jgi:hypothetical protein